MHNIPRCIYHQMLAIVIIANELKMTFILDYILIFSKCSIRNSYCFYSQSTIVKKKNTRKQNRIFNFLFLDFYFYFSLIFLYLSQNLHRKLMFQKPHRINISHVVIMHLGDFVNNFLAFFE